MTELKAEWLSVPSNYNGMPVVNSFFLSIFNLNQFHNSIMNF